MPKKYISEFTLQDGTVLFLKDAEAREVLEGGIKFRGVTTTYLVDGSSAFPITIDGQFLEQENGDVVIYGSKEFIWYSSDGEWHEFGDMSGLKALAYKDNASGNVTSFGSVSKPDVDVSSTTVTVKEVEVAGSVTDGSAASCSFPELVVEYDSEAEDLAISVSAGTFTPNTPTQVTLPTTKDTTVLTGVSAELHNAPVYTGESVQVTVS